MPDCKWFNDDYCVNDQCPCRADWCPVAGEYWEVCRWYEEVEDDG